MGNKAIEKAEYLKETKNLIRQALQEQGADITDSDPFRVFASIISNLKTNSGDDAIKVKTGEEIDNMTSEDTLVCICSKDYSYTDYDGVLVEYKRGVIYEVISGSVDKLLFDTDTTNYRELSNKPSINGVELNYNKSLTELGIQPKGDYALKKDLPRNTSELNNDSGFLTEFTEEDPTVPQYIKDITEEDINKWNASEEYKNLKNKPSINGVELNENKSLEELGIQPKGEYITEETDPTVPQHVKDITLKDIENWNNGIGEGTDIVAVDNLPIGSIIAFDGDEIPEGFEEVEDYIPVYSLEEKVIGTWIDGKPLYEKTIINTSKQLDLSDLNYDTLLIIYFGMYVSDYIMTPYYTSSSDYLKILVTDEKILTMITSHNSFEKIIVVVRYTKLEEVV